MIKTKEPQLIDAQNKVGAIVYLQVTHEFKSHQEQLRKFTITTLIEQVNKEGQTVLLPIKENIAIFKESTFIEQWGAFTLSDFNKKIDTFLIEQVEYINTYVWTGEESQEPVRFWDLKAEDLEIIK